MTTSVQTQIQVDGSIELSNQLTDIASNVLWLFSDPWYVAAIATTFMLGLATNYCLKVYTKVPYKSQRPIIWLAQLVGGYALTIFFLTSSAVSESSVEHALEMKFAVFSGVMTIILFYLLLAVSTKFNMPWLTNFLKVKIGANSDGDPDL